jgi:hypothetical protein
MIAGKNEMDQIDRLMLRIDQLAALTAAITMVMGDLSDQDVSVLQYMASDMANELKPLAADALGMPLTTDSKIGGTQ